MKTTVHTTSYDREAMTRTVEQTVIYTRADDVRALAQAQMALSNLYGALSTATHPTIAAQVESQIAEKEAEVAALQAIVNGYSGETSGDYETAYNIVTGESEGA